MFATRPPAEPRFVLPVAGAGAVVLVAALSLWSMNTADRESNDADRAAGVRDTANHLMIELLEAETAQRGFVLSEDPTFLHDHEHSLVAIDRSLARLRSEAPRAMAPELAVLQTTVTAKRTEMALTIEQVQSGNRKAALATIQTGAGKRAMASILASLDVIITAQNEVSRSRTAQKRATTNIALVIILAGSGIAVTAMLFGISALNRRHREHARTIKDLSAAAAELGTTNAALIRSNRDLDQFAYVTSHDLKAPLRGISSLATWIEEDLGDHIDAKVAEHLRLLRSRVHRLDLLIEGILTYSRAGRTDTATQVDTGSLVRRVVDVQPPPDGVEVVIERGPWPSFTTVDVQLQQVWMNLLANAYNHGRRADGKGKVVLSCHQTEEGNYRFSVADDGKGIEPRFHDRIFEMFQRLEARDKVEGAGIGLAIVRKLVTAHHGKVWIEASNGGGTNVCFTWRESP